MLGPFKGIFKDHGVGVGVRRPYFEALLDPKLRSPVQWGEVISENYLRWESGHRSPQLQKLIQVRKEIPIALHGVSLSLGSTDPINKNYLNRLSELKEMIHPLWISDHLCWTGHGGHNIHDLLPVEMTQEAAEHIIGRIQYVQDYFGERILVENVSSYVSFKHSQMKEWEFLNYIAQKADCGLLLDINNIYVSAINHSQDPYEFIESIDAHRVGQIHLAGHTDKGGFLIDTHDATICDPVWALYKKFHAINPYVSTMIERDDKHPPWHELQNELKMIQEIKSKSHPLKKVSKDTPLEF